MGRASSIIIDIYYITNIPTTCVVASILFALILER